jgi:hypothetical protein
MFDHDQELSAHLRGLQPSLKPPPRRQSKDRSPMYFDVTGLPKGVSTRLV